MFNSDVASPTAVSFSVASLKNPWSLSPFGPLSFELMYNGKLSQSCAPYLTVSLPRSLSIFSFPITNLEISATNTGVRAIFFTSSILPPTSNRRLEFNFPSSLSVSYTGTTYSSNTTQLVLQNIGGNSISSFNVVNPPSSRPITVTLTVYYFDTLSGLAYACETSSVPFQASVGSLSSVSVVAESYLVNQVNPYTIKLTLSHGLVSGSLILIKFPIQLLLSTVTGSCSMTGHTCAVSNSSYVKVSVGSTLAAETALTVVVNNVQNGNEGGTTGSF